jgi:hypothetical protein
MSLTEAKMWQKLTTVRAPSELLTRIETGDTHLGVADIEYVGYWWHGWIECKVGLGWREGSLARLQHPLTFQQYGWLLAHHRPESYLFSWLLVGREVDKTWYMIPASKAGEFTRGKVTWERARQLALVCTTPREVLDLLDDPRLGRLLR